MEANVEKQPNNAQISDEYGFFPFSPEIFVIYFYVPRGARRPRPLRNERGYFHSPFAYCILSHFHWNVTRP